MKHVFEIYTKHPETKERGWEIKFVYATTDGIKTFPLFDCIITTDDLPYGVKLINWI